MRITLSPVRDDGYSTDNSDVSGDIDIDHPEFGILFDVDGVLARGSTPLEPAKRAFEKLKDPVTGKLRVPCAFVTNSCNRSYEKAAQIGSWFNLKVTPEMVIHAPTPAKLLNDVHQKHTLVIGQEHRLEIAAELGFTNLCTLDDVTKAYPLLDMVDHENRRRVASGCYTENPDFPQIEAILLLAEPVKWESNLQVLLDLLLTEGKPVEAPKDQKTVNQLPLIACNMDLQFMAEACMPRLGHGAFLVCLEALYKKITGNELEYSNLVGKPCELTFRFADHTISTMAKEMGFHKPIKRLYLIGDNPNVDIYGANLYNRYLRNVWDNYRNGNVNNRASSGLPKSRIIPDHPDLHEQTVEQCHALLVGTGVYQHTENDNTETAEDMNHNEDKTVYHGHRDIDHDPDLSKPQRFVADVEFAIKHILEKEDFTIS
ncbi:haloacid dehalogenase-like hydrolase domain-containing 5 [Gigantopelta aegis]|uniref:haloacid dehalogenase-like hydrolase domain-containing 5 n=1 Tax=Gigantopelta aegis TaxID=1735272 RepID=UPI001B88D926|nr:haloacid dehalogenase-like hydrolase domain-containing 5 [Gigantopelta aegis]